MVVYRCLNFAEQSMKLSAGSTIGIFMRVEADQMDDCLLEAQSKKGGAEFPFKGSDKVHSAAVAIQYS